MTFCAESVACDSRSAGAEALVGLRIELGGAVVDAGAALSLESGDLLALEVAADAPVRLVAGGRAVALGELVTVDGHLAIRITERLDKPEVSQ